MLAGLPEVLRVAMEKEDHQLRAAGLVARAHLRRGDTTPPPTQAGLADGFRPAIATATIGSRSQPGHKAGDW
jgi:hypothetical protein